MIPDEFNSPRETLGFFWPDLAIRNFISVQRRVIKTDVMTEDKIPATLDSGLFLPKKIESVIKFWTVQYLLQLM